ncbi:MAG: hypothetical protein AAF653_08385, partial [Chloroflexota bacterium]
ISKTTLLVITLDTVLDDFAYTLKSSMTQQKMVSHHMLLTCRIPRRLPDGLLQCAAHRLQ